MRIGIDLRTPDHNAAASGATAYLRGLAGGLLAIDAGNEYHLFANASDGITGTLERRNAKFVRRASIPVYAAWHRLDVLHCTGFVPSFVRAAKVLTVPEINFEDHPEDCSEAESGRLQIIRGRCVAADLVLTCSALSRRRMHERWGIPLGKIVAAPSAADHLSDRAGLSRSPASLGLPDRYVVFPGGARLRHNVPRTLAAFDQLASRTRIPHCLVIPALRGETNGDFEDALRTMRNRSRVLVLRNLSESDLHLVLRAADVFACTWLYEGPGVTPMIAQRLDVPCLVSNSGCFAETYADSVVYCDPLDEQSIAVALERLLCQPLLRSELAIRGTERARRWSWKHTAAIVLEAYQRIVRDRAGERSSPAVSEA